VRLIGVHRLVVLAVIAALGSPARADVGASMLVHASSYGGIEEGGGGVMFELSRRRGRLEYFADLGVSVVSGKRGGVALGTGVDTNVLGGVRVIARSFVADEAALELAIDLFAGGQHMRWADAHVTRPQLGAGAGWQVRFREGKTVRIMTRIFAAPTFGDRAEPVCRGACPEEPRETTYGFMGLMGASW
jgi:hypothetical protein